MSIVTLNALEKLYADRIVCGERNIEQIPASICGKVQEYLDCLTSSEVEEIPTEAKAEEVKNPEPVCSGESASGESETTGEASDDNIAPRRRRKKKSDNVSEEPSDNDNEISVSGNESEVSSSDVDKTSETNNESENESEQKTSEQI